MGREVEVRNLGMMMRCKRAVCNHLKGGCTYFFSREEMKQRADMNMKRDIRMLQRHIQLNY